jgi:hypothetical protein
MRKKLALFALALALTAGSVAVRPAAALTCPTGSHLVTCPTRTFCCPDFAKCVCLPFA